WRRPVLLAVGASTKRDGTGSSGGAPRGRKSSARPVARTRP
ncbi:MAG: hypothetical protein AVDCRST_MAG65-916, partial [uncultured Solirubrobacteraceae bacterium]